MPPFLRSLAPNPDLTRRDIQLGLAWLMRNGLASQGMETLTVGAFTVAYAVNLGASNFMIGLLAAIPHLTQIVQLPGLYIVERVRNRRLVCVVAGALSRPMLLLMAAAALVPTPAAALALLTLGFAGRYAFGAIVGASWNAWIRDLVPERRMGRFFAKRLMLMTVLGAVLSLAAAQFVDLWKAFGRWPESQAYALLLVVAFGFGVASVYCMIRMPEPPMAGERIRLGLRALLAQPFRDTNFRRLIVFLGSWNFAINLAAPFFTVHMLKRLELDLTLIIGLTMLSQAANVVVLREWGRVADRFSNKSVLAICAPLFILCIFAWTFTTLPERHPLTVPLLIAIHVLTGIATAGVTLASGNIGLKLAPRGEATAYLASISLVNAAAAGVAPVIGGLFADFFLDRELALMIHWAAPQGELMLEPLNIRQWDFFFLSAAVLGIYSIHRLAYVREIGEVTERVVLNEVLLDAKRTVRNLSTVAGLRSASEFPLELLRRTIRRRRRRQQRARARARPEAGGAPSPG